MSTLILYLMEIEKTNSGPENYRPHRPFTDFSPVLEELGRSYENKLLQGVLFFSDGADLTEESGEISQGILTSLIKLKVPVHTFQAGSNDQFKDLALGICFCVRFWLRSTTDTLVCDDFFFCIGQPKCSSCVEGR